MSWRQIVLEAIYGFNLFVLVYFLALNLTYLFLVLLSLEDTVGIKSNVWRFHGTPPGLEAYIRRRVIDAGVSAERVAVGDRDVLHDTVFQNSTALINVRPMRPHHWAGVGSLIKNYIMFSPDPPSWHGDSCANLAGLWDLPIVKGKTRLNVLVLLTPLFQSKGPHGFDKQYTWPYRGLLVGLDPVATDATGLRILRAKRRAFFGRDEPFEISPKHIEVAESKYRLGIADAARIDVVKLGWQDYGSAYQRVPLITRQEVQAVLDVVKNPKGVQAKPEVFYDNSFVQKIEASGFINSLDAR